MALEQKRVGRGGYLDEITISFSKILLVIPMNICFTSIKSTLSYNFVSLFKPTTYLIKSILILFTNSTLNLNTPIFFNSRKLQTDSRRSILECVHFFFIYIFDCNDLYFIHHRIYWKLFVWKQSSCFISYRNKKRQRNCDEVENWLLLLLSVSNDRVELSNWLNIWTCWCICVVLGLCMCIVKYYWSISNLYRKIR